jgi:hypothetical protein
MRVLPPMDLSEHRIPAMIPAHLLHPSKQAAALPEIARNVNIARVRQAVVNLSHYRRSKFAFDAPHLQRQPATILILHLLA